MKNRKLFAIITLVAFMLTMMPMMAFAAATASGSSLAVEDASAKADGTQTLEFILDLDEDLDTQLLAIFAERNGSLSDADTIEIEGETGVGAVVLDTLTAGEYTIKVTSDVAGTVKLSAYIISGYDSAPTSIAKMYNGSADFIKTALVGNGVTGKFSAEDDTIAIEVTSVTLDGSAATLDDGVYVAADANNGVDAYKVTIKVTEGGSKLVGGDVEVSVNKAGVTLSKTELTTSSTGKADFKVSAKKPGTYTVSIVCGDEEEELKFNFATIGASEIAVDKVVADTIATKYETEKAAEFVVTDANGNKIFPGTSDLNDTFRVDVINAPADSTFEDAEDLGILEGNANKNWIDFTPDVPGTYTFKVFNDTTGVGETFTITAAKFGTIDHATLAYTAPTYLVGSSSSVPTVKIVDENGVVKKVTSNLKFSYSGLGVATFDQDTGEINFKSTTDYSGNQIVVNVVYKDKYPATATITVGTEPAALAFADATAGVGQEATAKFNVTDIKGGKTAIGLNADYAVEIVNALVVERPAGAMVSVDADSITGNGKADFVQKGTGSIKVLSNKEGVVKVNLVVKVTANDEVIKDGITYAAGTYNFYLSGVANVGFGTAAVESDETSTVTLIIGSTTFVANGKAEVAPVAPAVIDGRTLVPVRAFAQATGAEVVYDGNTKVITITAEGLLAQMTVGSNILTVNGQTIVMDSAATLIDGSTVLPVRYAGQALGYDFECAYGANGAVASVTMFK